MRGKILFDPSYHQYSVLNLYGLIINSKVWYAAVSYTHLDVYKRQALEREDDRILYLMQDMREFEPGEKVSAVVSACDSINYIHEPEDLQAVFFCESESLKEGGIFIFDINTPYKYEVLMADNTRAENRDEGSFIWDNYYDACT